MSSKKIGNWKKYYSEAKMNLHQGFPVPRSVDKITYYNLIKWCQHLTLWTQVHRNISYSVSYHLGKRLTTDTWEILCKAWNMFHQDQP